VYQPRFSSIHASVTQVNKDRSLQVEQLLPESIGEVMTMLSEAAAIKGQLPLAEDKWNQLKHGLFDTRLHSGYLAFFAKDPSEPRRLSGYIHICKPRSRWEIALVVHPLQARAFHEIGEKLLTKAVAEIANRGGGEVQLWIADPDPVSDGLAEQFHLIHSRDLYQMRTTLTTEIISTLSTRAFRPGHDEMSWLELNNRAFPSHPEQSNWTLDELLEREAEEWFDPNGFLLHEVDGHLQGACWTKIHRETDPPLGEIYVLSVDPAHQRHGLGRALLQEGLAWLQRSGITQAMLYVDDSNLPALELYRKNGFSIEHVNKAYRGFISQ